ncbi:hypothetical protein [Stutzerimonas stutzeri]|uniref:hypothetical protein n=1 Tax=Stutzerimonas stutzeri TaxID=316 RepID=UPI0034D65807
MSKVLVDRELLERCVDRWACCAIVETPGAEQAWLELRAVVKAAQPAEAEGVEAVAWLHRQGNHTEAADRPLTEDEEARGWEQDELLTVTQHLAALSAVTAERDRLRDAAGKAIAWLDAEQNESGVGINRRLKLCRDAENSLRAAMAAKEA